jgi:outer membrane protein TolC
MKPFDNHRKRAFEILPLLLLAVTPAFAQIGLPNAPSQGTLANQLPLSGTGGQSGAVTAAQAPVSGATTSVNTLNTSVQASGPYTGSIDSAAKMPFSGTLSFIEAIHRGLDYNLGTEGVTQAIRQAQGESKVARSSLLPNLSATASEAVQQVNLKDSGVRVNSSIPGVTIPSIAGPFNYFDLRAHLTQTIGDLTAWKNYRSAQEIVRSNDFTLKDARDLVVLAVGGSYLQVAAAKERVISEQAQLDTATALYNQSSQQRAVGLLAQIDVNRSRIQMLTEQERLETLRNDLAKQKINLARMVGLPANDHFDISGTIPFSAGPSIEIETAIRNAYTRREDLKAAEAQLRASQLALSAARAERLPSLAVNADYGVNGTNPNQSHGTFSATGTLTIPIWRGGRTEGDVQQADAAFVQRRAELNNLHARIEGDVRSAYLDMQAAANQVSVAEDNLKVSQENLDLTRQKFQVGVSDNVEVIQAQQSVASAQLDLINSVLAHNVAKLTLARAIGDAADSLSDYLKLP